MWRDTMLRDIRFAWRVARRQRWTMVAAIATIGIAVGANTAVTSVLEAVLLNPLGIRNAGRIVAASVRMNKLQMRNAETSAVEWRDLKSMSDVFAAVAATEPRAWTLDEAGEPSRLIGLAVTPEFFQVFDGRSLVGAHPDAADPHEIFLSYGLWQSLFGGSRAAVGSKLSLDGKLFRVVGVAARDAHFPTNAQAWVPLVLTPERYKRNTNMSLSIFARLRRGISFGKARERVDRAIGNLETSPEGAALRKMQYGIDLEPLSRHIAGDLRRPLLLLWSAALILLVTACANVAGLLLARSMSRRKEIAIRMAVGGSRLQIVRQLFTESLVLGLAGGASGLAFAAVGLELARHASFPQPDTLLLAGLNSRLLLYGFSLALGSSIVFGIAPAIELMREQWLGAFIPRRRKWFQNAYIVGQVSAAILLALLTGLLLRSLKAIESVHPGFDPRDITTAFLIKPGANQPAFFDRVLSELRAKPGVQSAALSYPMPFSGESPTRLFDIKGHHHLSGEPEWHAAAHQVSPGYFETLHVPVLRGRTISEFDGASSPAVCVIDAMLAERFFPNEDPIGQQIRMYSSGARIVGVVGAVKDSALEGVVRPTVYYPLAQISYFPEAGVVVRSSRPAAAQIRDAVRRADSTVAVFDVKSMQERIEASLGTRSAIAWSVTIFSAITVLLAGLGIHALITQVVSERTAEIGIRMAIGARPSDIFKGYVLQGLRLSLAGTAIGLSATAAGGKWLESFLYDVRVIDAPTWILGVLGVLIVSGIAVFGPSWRASHIDPQTALRTE